jgi:hypothetical protein
MFCALVAFRLPFVFGAGFCLGCFDASMSRCFDASMSHVSVFLVCPRMEVVLAFFTTSLRSSAHPSLRRSRFPFCVRPRHFPHSTTPRLPVSIRRTLSRYNNVAISAQYVWLCLASTVAAFTVSLFIGMSASSLSPHRAVRGVVYNHSVDHFVPVSVWLRHRYLRTESVLNPQHPAFSIPFHQDHFWYERCTAASAQATSSVTSCCSSAFPVRSTPLGMALPPSLSAQSISSTPRSPFHRLFTPPSV